MFDSKKLLVKKYLKYLLFLSLVAGIVAIMQCFFLKLVKVEFITNYAEYGIDYFSAIFNDPDSSLILIDDSNAALRLSLIAALNFSLIFMAFPTIIYAIHSYCKKSNYRAVLDSTGIFMLPIISAIYYIYCFYLLITVENCSILEYLRGETLVKTEIHWLFIIETILYILEIYIKHLFKKKYDQLNQNVSIRKETFKDNASIISETENGIDQITYKVIAESANYTMRQNKIQLIKAIMDTFDYSLHDAKRIVDNFPSIVKENISYDDAQRIKSLLESHGLIITIDQSK